MFFYDMKKRGFLVLGLFACTLLSARWIPFKQNVAESEPQIEVLSADAYSVKLNIRTFGLDVRDVNTEQTTDKGKEIFTLLSIGEYAHMGDIGKPKMPIITTVLDVPHRAEISVEVISAEYEEIDLIDMGIDNRIMPALASVSKTPDTRAEFVIDEQLYALDVFYPERIVTIEEHEGYARGHRLATVQVLPIHYNPARGTIRYYKDIQLSINFVGGDILSTQRIIEENYSPVWEDFIEKIVVNYPSYLRNVLPLPIYYDIFYNGQTQTVANKLADWKTKKGFKVRMWNAAGWSAAAIDDTIEAQNPQPTFLVVIGDPNSSIGLPSGSATAYSGQTDLYYAEMDGTGYLPDLFHARISVADTIQGNTVVEKAIRYEQADFGSAGTAWLMNACLIAGYDPYGNQAVGMATNAYCRDLLIANGYTVDTLVIASGEEEARVVSQINSGRAWMVYTAHGSQTEWSVGYYSDLTVSELTNLTSNLDMYCFPAGHCCLTGDFDYSQQCFGETWDRLSGKGGLSYFGSVPSTYWDEDDWLQRRYFDAIYTDSIPGRLYETGRFTQWGLYWIENNTNTYRKKYYFEAYHIFNDPSLDFWTDIPVNMAVTHNAIVFPGSADYTVMVNGGGSPVENALVCLWIPSQSPEMHSSEYTDASGSVTFNIAPTTPGDTMYVTVTAHNYIPYEGYATVIAPSGPYLMAGSYVIDDGNNNQPNPGDTVDLGLWARNIGIETAYSVYGLLSEDDMYVTMNTDSSWYGNIASSDSAMSSPYYSFAIGNDCPDAHNINFTAEFTDADDSTWTSNVVVTVYAPVLVYQEHEVLGGNGNGILDPGETVDLVVTLENEGGADVLNVTSTLFTSSSFVTINDGVGNFGTIAAGATASNAGDPYSVTADVTTPHGTTVDFSIALQAGDYVDTLDFSLMVGQLVPSDTGYYYVYYSGGPHTYSPVFDWVAIDSTQTVHPGVPLDLGDDEYVLVSLPFSFPYYGINYTQVTISSNGWVAMGSQTSSYLTNYGIPSTSGPSAMIAGIWDDLDPGNTGAPSDIYYYHDAVNHRFIIEYFQVEHWSSGFHETFEIILYDPAYYPTPTGDGEVVVQYLVGLQQTDVTLGIENSAETVGIQYYYEGTYHELAVAVTDSFALRYTTYPPDYVGIEEYEELTQLPVRTLLAQVYPNPFARELRVSYQLASSSRVSLAVYDAAGRAVCGLVDGVSEPGYYLVSWDGCDDRGRRVPAGVYFVRFHTDDYQSVQKTVLLK